MGRREMHLCPMCGRNHIKDHMTVHHLHPAVKRLDKGEPIVYLCMTCHQVIHYCHTNEQLRIYYNSIDALLNSKKVQNMLQLYKYKSDNCVFKIKRLKRLRYSAKQSA